MAMVPAEQNGNNLLNVVQQLNAVFAASEKLPSVLVSVNEALQRIQHKQVEIERVARSNATLDPETAQEIRELQKTFGSCISCAKVFITECEYAAEYGLDEEIKEQIKEELEQGQLDTLGSFLTRLVQRLEQSKQQLEIFDGSQAEANKIAKEMTTKYQEKFAQAKRDGNTAKDQQVRAALLGNVITGAKVLSVMGIVGGVKMTGSWPKAGLCTAIASGAVGCGASVLEHVAAARGLAATNVFTWSITDQAGIEKALQSIGDLQTSMGEVVRIIDDIRAHVQRAHRNAIQGLEPHNEIVNRAVKQDISRRLENVYKSLRGILQVLRNRQSISDSIFLPNLD